MERDLEDGRELGVDGRHRPRDRGLDDGAGALRVDGEGVGELGPIVQIPSGGVLARPSGPLQHLLGPGEERHHPPRGRRLVAVGVDGELRTPQRRSALGAGTRGEGRHVEATGDFRGRRVLHERVGVRPVPHEERAPALEIEAGLFLLPREGRLRHRPVGVDGVPHEREGPNGLLGVDSDPSVRLQHPPAEGPEVLEEGHHESFVPGPLPDEAVGDPFRAGTGRLQQGSVAGGRGVEQIAPPVEHSHVHEPGDGVEGVLPEVRPDGGVEEGVRRGIEGREREDPSRGGELGGPDHVELEDVRVRTPGDEPLDVELMALIGGVGGGPDLHPDVGMLLLKGFELSAEDVRLGSHRAPGDRDPGDAFVFEDTPDEGEAEREEDRQWMACRLHDRGVGAPGRPGRGRRSSRTP